MAGGVDRLERPAVAVDDRSIRHLDVRGERRVDAFAAAHSVALGQFGHHGAAPRVRPAKGQNRRAGALRQRTGQRRVVQMRVGDDDVGDLLIRPHAGQNRLKVRVILGAGVDHGQTAGAQ